MKPVVEDSRVVLRNHVRREELCASGVHLHALWRRGNPATLVCKVGSVFLDLSLLVLHLLLLEVLDLGVDLDNGRF